MNKLSFFLLMMLFASCKSINTNIFPKKTPHEAYEEKLDDKGLDNTPEGRAWLAASIRALENAQPVSLPYQHKGFFNAGRSSAVGLSFSAKRGEKITIKLVKQSAINLFADVFMQTNNNDPVFSSDATTNEFSFDAETTGNYTLRLQPQLKNSGNYHLVITKGPSLQFPVSGKAKVGSFWGAERDGGKRKHEGIDIFAPKLSPAVAAADGIITGVRDEGIGGKTVWLRPLDKNLTLYYAHLDQQLVTEGQMVKKGEVVGLVGNTGNAKTTPPHLHFGVYTFSGAVDPFPYVDQQTKTPADIPYKELSKPLKIAKTFTINGKSIPGNTSVLPLAANANGYIAELPDGMLISLPFHSVKTVSEKERVAIVRSRSNETE